jgi:hypothetical protein
MLLAPFALVLGGSLVKPLFVNRYLIVALLGLFLLAGAGLSRLRPGIAVATVLVFVAASLPGLVAWYTTDDREDWRGAAALVRRSALPDDVVVVSRLGVPVFSHYEDDHAVYEGRRWSSVGRSSTRPVRSGSSCCDPSARTTLT